MSSIHDPALILLAGTSESGKSTAGRYLAARGAQHIKIRTILLQLTSGIEVHHEGFATREGFDTADFLVALRQRIRRDNESTAVVESFIDAELALMTKVSQAGHAVIVFITADEGLRIHRLAAAKNMTQIAACDIIRRKDARKRISEQWDIWRQIADHWIDNDHDVAHFERSLDEVFANAYRLAMNRGHT